MDDCRILGLDNSTQSTGWAVVDVKADAPTLVDYGLILRKGVDITEALVLFESELERVIAEFNPDRIAAEQMFIGANRVTAMSLGYIHGVMLLVARKRVVPVTYYQPMVAKGAVLGGVKWKREDGTRKTGKDLKLEVQRVVFDVLGEENFTRRYTDDVTDACSMALTYWKVMTGQATVPGVKTRETAMETMDRTKNRRPKPKKKVELSLFEGNNQ